MTNIQTALYVTADQEPVEGFVGTVSPMLTVWRKLHLEFDSMAAPPTSGPEANYSAGKVIGVSPAFYGPSRSLVKVQHAGSDYAAGLFERGRIEIATLGTFRINRSATRTSANGNSISDLEVDAFVAANAMGQDVKLFDDDDQYLANSTLYPSLLNLQSPPLPALPEISYFITVAQPKFASAYITLINVNTQAGWNTTTIIPFKLYEHGFRLGGTVVFDNGNLQLKGTDRQSFWAFSVAFGYQAASDIAGVPFRLNDDGDPDKETPLSGGAEVDPKNWTRG